RRSNGRDGRSALFGAGFGMSLATRWGISGWEAGDLSWWPPARRLPARFRATAGVAATATTITAAAAEAAAARRLRPRFVDSKAAPFELEVVQLVDCLLRLGVCAHLDEREPAGASGRHVAHHLDAVDG